MKNSFPVDNDVQLTFGLILAKHDYNVTLERGAEANTAAARQFLTFWGPEVSQLRRFPDGSMAEGVLWKAESEHEKRLICGQIIRHALSRHAAIGKKSVIYMGNLWDNVLAFQRFTFRTTLRFLALVRLSLIAI